jgi:hypothetical protein
LDCVLHVYKTFAIKSSASCECQLYAQ